MFSTGFTRFRHANDFGRSLMKNKPDGRSTGLELALWLWVAVVGVAYLFQFRDLAGPFLKIIGI